MATNVYFNNFQNNQEQLLIENLVIESIKIYGHDLFYLPRTLVASDALYGEENYTRFDSHYLVEMYIKNVEGFAGQGDFLSKFNLEIRDQITFTIARRVFDEEVGSFASLQRPREGDLIYFPLNKKLFEIKFIEHEAIFYQLGSLQTYDITCELFEYNNEILNTGIEDIDNIQKTVTLNVVDFGITTENDTTLITTENGYPIVQESFDIKEQEPISDNKLIQTESDQILDFSEQDPFSEKGTW